MVDVVHASNADMVPGHRHTEASETDETHTVRTSAADAPQESASAGNEAEDEAAAWLKSLQAANADLLAVKRVASGSLAMDSRQLRTEAPNSAPRRSTKGKLLA